MIKISITQEIRYTEPKNSVERELKPRTYFAKYASNNEREKKNVQSNADEETSLWNDGLSLFFKIDLFLTISEITISPF